MKLTHALLGEHAVIHALLDHVEQELPGLDDLADLQRVSRTLAAALISHARIEDEMLFPALETHLGLQGPLAVMRFEHAGIEAAIEQIASARTHEVAVERFRYALGVARDHLAKEERVLFHLARLFMSEQDLEKLGDRWAVARGVANEEPDRRRSRRSRRKARPTGLRSVSH